MKSGLSKNGMVADGPLRLRRALAIEIRREVEAKYATDWAKAGFYRRLRLRAKIESEIQKRAHKATPRYALYFRGRQTANTTRPWSLMSKGRESPPRG
jgi:hypothetical protein